MKKIAVINDLSGLGKCSLTAAIPVISVMGVQACPFPTAVLSNQTGYETYFCEDFTEHMAPYMEEWKKRGFVPHGIYTGLRSSLSHLYRRTLQQISGTGQTFLCDHPKSDRSIAPSLWEK